MFSKNLLLVRHRRVSQPRALVFLMVTTRTQEKAIAATQKRNAERRAFQASYKGLTPKQQSIKRHNRFLQRVWKMPPTDRMQHTKCVACLGDFFDKDSSYFGVMACDHLIHLDCMIKHADAYCDRMGVPSLDNLDALTYHEVAFACQERFVFRTLGAPCPACRLDFPMRHMTVFDNTEPTGNVQKYPRL